MILSLFASKAMAQRATEANTGEIVGDGIQLALPAIAFSIELIRKDKEGMIQFAKAFGVNVLVLTILKRTINKPRPGGYGAYAFPSGHTAAAFQAASFIHRRYGFKYSIPAYAGAMYVGYFRDKGARDRHDMWDVAAGAILGTTMSFIFAKKAKFKKVRVYSYPLDGGGAAFKLNINLGN